MGNVKTVSELRPGESGTIVEIQGGPGMVSHLESMGVRAGKRLTKISAQIWRGPQIIKIDNMRIAVGFGMSKRILVEVKK